MRKWDVNRPRSGQHVKAKVTVSLDDATVEAIDAVRGDTTRSEFIRQLLERWATDPGRR